MMPDGRFRVVVRVLGRGRFVGLGRTYALAKSAAANAAFRRSTGKTVADTMPAPDTATTTTTTVAEEKPCE